MDLKKKQLILSASIIFALLGSAIGQGNMDLNFQGLFSDSQGKSISNEEFNLNVQVLSVADKNILWESEMSAKTDEDGWFGFSINMISRLLHSDGQYKTLEIRLNLAPNEKTRWLREGDDFMVSYNLTPVDDGGNVKFEMTRIEGSELVYHHEDHLHAFKDQYPYYYLTGGFIITVPPIETGSLADLRQWISPDSSSEVGTASRGVKGGFPKGGYRKKN